MNPIGSTDPRDLYDNSYHLDEFANSPNPTSLNRLGAPVYTLAGLTAAAVEVAGLREQLLAPDGATHVSFIQLGSGAGARTVQSKIRERVSPADYQAAGDGAAVDDSPFVALEASNLGRDVSLLGKTHVVTAAPVGNRYSGGFFKIGGVTFPSAYQDSIRCWDRPLGASGPGAGGLAIGTGAAANIPDYSDGNPSQGFIAIGRDALGTSPRGRMCIAIGSGVMSRGSPGVANIGIGDFALRHLNGTTSAVSGTAGSRTIGIGTLAGYFLTSGFRNSLIGRDSGQNLTTGQSNTANGYRCLSSNNAPVGLSGEIENQVPSTCSYNTAMGDGTLAESNGNYNTAYGVFAGQRLKSSSLNALFGALAGGLLDSDLSENSKILTTLSLAGTYSQAGTSITVNATASGVVAGNKVAIAFTSGPISLVTTERQWMTVTSVINADTFVLTSPVSLIAVGAVLITTVESAATRLASGTNTLLGVSVLANSKTANGVTAGGWEAGINSEGSSNTLFGQRSGYNLTTGATNTFIGFSAGRANPLGGSVTTFSNSSVLGASGGVSASNQVQLGDAATTTYVYGTVQNRSDIRDKTDIRKTTLGLDFILALEPVDYRWDMREDYIEWVVDEETRADVAVMRERDGSKARTRFHHGFRAQDFYGLRDKGMEFGGFQDHAVAGGCDVLSLGYDEFIAPLVRAVQELTERLAVLEAA